jgi:hypothetical protein
MLTVYDRPDRTRAKASVQGGSLIWGNMRGRRSPYRHECRRSSPIEYFRWIRFEDGNPYSVINTVVLANRNHRHECRTAAGTAGETCWVRRGLTPIATDLPELLRQ